MNHEDKRANVCVCGARRHRHRSSSHLIYSRSTILSGPIYCLQISAGLLSAERTSRIEKKDELVDLQELTWNAPAYEQL